MTAETRSYVLARRQSRRRRQCWNIRDVPLWRSVPDPRCYCAVFIANTMSRAVARAVCASVPEASSANTWNCALLDNTTRA
jgi:hypothetical protein